MNKVYIKTLGCEKNTVDSQCAMGILEECGYTQTENPEDADLLLVNTCGFILDAKQQSIESIFDLVSLKTDKQILIISGCLSQRYAKELAEEIPEADAFLGVDDYEKLRNLAARDFSARMLTEGCRKEFAELPRKISGEYTACIKIAEGCSNICSYCAIPLMRGRYRSRSEDAILREAKMLADAGCRELVVIAQDVTGYGKDLQQPNALPALLHKLCGVEGIQWIRLMYCYEDEITDELIECIQNEPKICKYIDIPIQHCSDKLLKAMNRKSTKASIKSTVNKLRKQIPGITIRTTLITGFPGENKQDFKELYEFVEEMQFDRLGVFAYSKEEGTAAARMEHQVKQDAKERRRDKIMELQRGISLAHNEGFIGKTLQVLVEEQDTEDVYIGRTAMDAPEIDNAVLFKSPKPLKCGDFVQVMIQDAFDYDLSGVLVNEDE